MRQPDSAVELFAGSQDWPNNCNGSTVEGHLLGLLVVCLCGSYHFYLYHNVIARVKGLLSALACERCNCNRPHYLFIKRVLDGDMRANCSTRNYHSKRQALLLQV